jgi:3-hydroxyisobutyrate dehydrogenase-like beta-hydroxyacid dehydrogenase
MTRDDVVVGFIGLGIMGGRMAANLQKAGYKLVVHDLQRQRPVTTSMRARPGLTIRAHSLAIAA